MNIFGLGLPEMMVIMVFALLIFGPKKLPEIGRSVGKTIRGFQDASRDFQAEFTKEVDQLDRVDVDRIDKVASSMPINEAEPTSDDRSND